MMMMMPTVKSSGKGGYGITTEEIRGFISQFQDDREGRVGARSIKKGQTRTGLQDGILIHVSKIRPNRLNM